MARDDGELFGIEARRLLESMSRKLKGFKVIGGGASVLNTSEALEVTLPTIRQPNTVAPDADRLALLKITSTYTGREVYSGTIWKPRDNDQTLSDLSTDDDLTEGAIGTEGEGVVAVNLYGASAGTAGSHILATTGYRGLLFLGYHFWTNHAGDENKKKWYALVGVQLRGCTGPA